MPSTRRSARLASSQTSSKEDSPKPAAGSKRKSETGASPTPKRGKKDVPKEQKTIEDTMDIDQSKPSAPEAEDEEVLKKASGESSGNEAGKVDDPVQATAVGKEDSTKQATEDAKQAASAGDGPKKASETAASSDEKPSKAQNSADGPSHSNTENEKRIEKDQERGVEESKHQLSSQNHSGNNAPESKVGEKTGGSLEDKEAKETQSTTQKQPETASDEKPSTNGTAIEAHARDDETPSSILEKGIIYFFFRGRVGIDDPSNVQDIARSYLVLRPLPHGAKLGDGPIGASENKCRLLALPKKVLPTSGKDRFMIFVEKTHTSFTELKKSFLPADDYETQTAGTRHSPAATPIAEGVYAITTTGRENHLAYMLTIPSSLGDVQNDMGLRDQGSFVVSCKNPQFPGPSYASLPKGPDFSKEILDEFRSLRWIPLQPKHLDFENAQFILIGESSGIDKAFEIPDNKQDANEDNPKTEMEKLEGEDEIRVKHLKGDDAIFADLGVSKKDYPSVPTTWDN